MKRKIIYFIMFTLLLAGCASVKPAQPSNLTPGMANKTLIKGQTTQNEILTVFGAPNIITRNKSGNEVWTYDKASIEAGSSSVYATILVVGGVGSRAQSSAKTFTLMIEFDDKNVVKDFSYRSASF